MDIKVLREIGTMAVGIGDKASIRALNDSLPRDFLGLISECVDTL